MLSERSENPAFERRGVIARLDVAFLEAIAPENLAAPDYEMTSASSVAPDRGVQGRLSRAHIELPRLSGPWIQIDDQRFAAAVGTAHQHWAKRASMDDDGVTGRLQHLLAFVAIFRDSEQVHFPCHHRLELSSDSARANRAATA
jgi:hypothetical protein